MQASQAAAAPVQTPTSTHSSNQSYRHTKRTAKDYIFGKLIGDGCYSTVFLAKDIHTGKEYASKYLCVYCISKQKLLVIVLLLFIVLFIYTRKKRIRKEKGSLRKSSIDLT